MGNAVQASTAAQTQAINTEIGGFISSPAISPRTIKANRNNHSFISFTAVLSHSSFWNTFFPITLSLTKYRNKLLHVKEQICKHPPKEFVAWHSPESGLLWDLWKITCWWESESLKWFIFTPINIIVLPTNPSPLESIHLSSENRRNFLTKIFSLTDFLILFFPRCYFPL